MSWIGPLRGDWEKLSNKTQTPYHLQNQPRICLRAKHKWLCRRQGPMSNSQLTILLRASGVVVPRGTTFASLFYAWLRITVASLLQLLARVSSFNAFNAAHSSFSGQSFQGSSLWHKAIFSFAMLRLSKFEQKQSHQCSLIFGSRWRFDNMKQVCWLIPHMNDIVT